MSSETFWMMVLVIGVILALSSGVGYRQMKKANMMIATATDKIKVKYPDVEIIGSVAYQGGLPQFPEPSVLLLALNKELLVVYNERDFAATVSIDDWLEVEKFTLQPKTDNKGRSSFMLGPFGSLFFKNKCRLFIAIRYTDIDREENNILFELSDKTVQQTICDKLMKQFTQFQSNKAS